MFLEGPKSFGFLSVEVPVERGWQYSLPLEVWQKLQGGRTATNFPMIPDGPKGTKQQTILYHWHCRDDL